MKKWLLALCLLLPSLAYGQNFAAPTSTVVDGTGHPVAGATVTVCSGALSLPPSGTVCSPATTIFSSFSGASQTNPFTTDGFGNWPFFAPVGNYVVSISGGPLIATSFYVSVGGNGTLTSFSSGNLSPLFTASVATPTTTPALSFALSSAAGNSVFANCTGSPATPSYCSIVLAMLASLGGSSTTVVHGNGSAGAVNLATDVTGQLPIGAVGSAGLSGTSPIVVAATGAISCPTCSTTSNTVTEATWVASCNTAISSGCGITTGIVQATIFPSSHTLTRIIFSVDGNNNFVTGCSVSPVISFRDETGASNLASVTVTNSTGFVDSGALSVAMTAGHKFSFNETTGGSGCSLGSVAWQMTAVYQ